MNNVFTIFMVLGLAIGSDEMFIADSESSCIRKLSLVDGKVLAVAGGDRNPRVSRFVRSAITMNTDAVLRFRIYSLLVMLMVKVSLLSYNTRWECVSVGGKTLST